MRPYSTAVVLGFLVLASGPGLAQSASPSAPARRPQPPTAEPATTPGSPLIDLDATRKRFDINSARTADRDRKRDTKLKQSMGSICAGCDAGSPAKRTRHSRPAPTTPEDDTSAPE